jgi:hypothetical protein
LVERVDDPIEQGIERLANARFNTVLKAEIEHLDADLLPLQEGLSQSSHAMADQLSAMILAVADEPDCLRVKAGLFYTGIIAGCGCADDPTPVDEINEYCVVRFDIDKTTAETKVTLLPE